MMNRCVIALEDGDLVDDHGTVRGLRPALSAWTTASTRSNLNAFVVVALLLGVALCIICLRAACFGYQV